MKTLILSDVHLEPNFISRYETFFQSLESICYDQLFILGDLFESWVGDDSAEKADLWLSKKFFSIKKPLNFLHGNRDFLIGNSFCKKAGFKLIQDPMIRMGDWRLWLSHGDEWCLSDLEYQNFRRTVRKSEWKKMFLGLSIKERKRLAGIYRQNSIDNFHNNSDSKILNIDQDIVRSIFVKNKIDLIIPGHTHTPGIHIDKSHCRVVTSDWDQQGSGIAVLLSEKKNKITVTLVKLHPSIQPRIVDRIKKTKKYPNWNRDVELG